MASLHYLSPLFVLRFICGFFFIPHIVGKYTARDASFGFFKSAGFNPPAPYVYTALCIETVLAVMLIFGLYVHIVGWIACGYLLIASASVFKVSKRWLWHIGGGEFPVFWAICCGVVAALAR